MEPCKQVSATSVPGRPLRGRLEKRGEAALGSDTCVKKGRRFVLTILCVHGIQNTTTKLPKALPSQYRKALVTHTPIHLIESYHHLSIHQCPIPQSNYFYSKHGSSNALIFDSSYSSNLRKKGEKLRLRQRYLRKKGEKLRLR